MSEVNVLGANFGEYQGGKCPEPGWMNVGLLIEGRLFFYMCTDERIIGHRLVLWTPMVSLQDVILSRFVVLSYVVPAWWVIDMQLGMP